MNLIMNALRNILILFLLIACSSRTSETAHTFQIYEEGGVTIAKTSGGPKYEGELFSYELILTLKEDLEIPESLIRFPDFRFAMDEEGMFYVADRLGARVLAFGTDGQYLRSYGGRGEGPGEFLQVKIQAVQGDTLCLFDPLLKRATYYRTDGTLLDIISHPSIRARLSGLWRDSASHIYQHYYNYRNEEEFQLYGRGIRVLGALGDTLADIRTPLVRTAFRIQSGSVSGGVSLPYSGEPVVIAVPSGRILRTTGEEPLIEFFNLHGDLIRRISIELPEEIVNAEERRRIREKVRADAENASEGREGEFERAMLDDLVIPDHKAYWSDVFVDDFGYIWLRFPRADIAPGSDKGVSYRVLSPEGEYLGDTLWPGEYGRIDKAKLLTMDINIETGEIIPVVYQLSPTTRDFRYP